MNMFVFQLKLWAQCWFVSKEKRAIVAFEQNNIVNFTTGKLKEKTEKTYEYRYNRQALLVPIDVPHYTWMGRRLLHAGHGEFLSRVFDKQTIFEINDAFFNEWAQSKAIVDVTATFSGKSVLSWKIILVGVVVLVGAYLAWKFLLNQDASVLPILPTPGGMPTPIPNIFGGF